MAAVRSKSLSHTSAASKWAALISSTHTTKRPFSLLELATITREAIAEAGSLEAAADRILLSPRMLKQFLLADRLDPLVKPMVTSRKIDSVDAVGYLVLLNKSDQRFVAKELAEKRILTSDLRAIRDQRRIMPTEPIRSLVQHVTDTRTKQVYVAEFAVRGGIKKAMVIKHLNRALGPNLVADVELDGPVGRVLFTRKGRDALKGYAKDQGISLTKALPRLIYQL